MIVDQDGNELASNYLACLSENAIGLEEEREWIEAFVLPFLPAPTIENYTLATPHSIREVFWSHWLQFKKEYPYIRAVTDCGYPVETNFLTATIKDFIERGLHDEKWNAPYPLLDLSNFLARRRKPRAVTQ